MESNPIQKAVDVVGTQVAFAKAIRDWHSRNGRIVKVSQAHVWAWININKTPAPPAEHCVAISAVTDYLVTPHELRPDIYPHPADGLPQELRTQSKAQA